MEFPISDTRPVQVHSGTLPAEGVSHTHTRCRVGPQGRAGACAGVLECKHLCSGVSLNSRVSDVAFFLTFWILNFPTYKGRTIVMPTTSECDLSLKTWKLKGRSSPYGSISVSNGPLVFSSRQFISTHHCSVYFSTLVICTEMKGLLKFFS